MVLCRCHIADLLHEASLQHDGLTVLSAALGAGLTGADAASFDRRRLVEHISREIQRGNYVIVQHAPTAADQQPAAPRPAAQQQCALTTYVGTNLAGDPAVVDVEFVAAMDRINGYASNRGVTVVVTHSFRAEGQAVNGAIVPPADRSNHKAGHAIDMNIRHQGTLYNSGSMTVANLPNLPDAVRGFLQDIRDDAGLRWGGDFGDPDEVHIDDHLNANEQRWLARFNACQEARRSGCG